MGYTDQTLAFIQNTQWTDLTEPVKHQSKRCLLDALGALIAGHKTPVGELMENFAKDQFPGDQASILVSGQRVSASGAALANGFAGNALDIDDGYRPTMGHPGACILPPILAASQMALSGIITHGENSGSPVTGQAFLTAFVIGYEVGTRAGLIRHATYETYHSSGSWGAICGTAAAGKLLGFSKNRLCHALGAAEYHAPIAPMMKCIDVPSMGKDSIGWGCLVAIMSLIMADRGFTGIQPLFDDSPDPEWIDSFGREWEILKLYFKPYSACRWAQPGVDGALKIVEENSLTPRDIQEIKVYTFEEAAALNQAYPQNTEEAQYNIAFPIAAALLDGEVGPGQTLPPRLFDRDIHEMMDKIQIIAQDRFQTNFPEKAESEVEISTHSGVIYTSGVMSARWDPHTTFPTDKELEDKFIWLVAPVLGQEKADELKKTIGELDRADSLDNFFKLCIR